MRALQANKMVATERMRLAETEEALREAREQGEALKNVLRLFERDAAAGFGKRSSVVGPKHDPPLEPEPHRSRHRASSSAVGIKAPSSGIPSPASHPSSPAQPPTSLPSSAKTITPEPASPPVPRSTDEHTTPHPTPAPLADAEPSVSRPGAAAAVASPASQEPASSALAQGLDLHVSAPTGSSPSLSPSLPPSMPSPMSGGQFLFAPQRPVNYYDGEESPWADAPSSSPQVGS